MKEMAASRELKWITRLAKCFALEKKVFFQDSLGKRQWCWHSPHRIFPHIIHTFIDVDIETFLAGPMLMYEDIFFDIWIFFLSFLTCCSLLGKVKIWRFFTFLFSTLGVDFITFSKWIWEWESKGCRWDIQKGEDTREWVREKDMEQTGALEDWRTSLVLWTKMFWGEKS